MASTRRLSAILAADVAGYSRLMGEDEEGTHKRLRAHLGQLVEPKIKEHQGRIVKNTGDGVLAEFPSVVDAMRCAVGVQRGMIDREPGLADERRIKFRIGINLGDVIAEGGDIFGDGVNVAARLESLAEPGGICISRTVRDQIRDKLPYPLDDMGEQSEEHRAARAGLCLGVRSRRRVAGIKPTARHLNASVCRRATLVDRRAAIQQSQQRSGAGIFRRRDHRGSDDRSVADRGHVRDLAQYCIHL
jgi:class 3 adenylate cyclase